MPLQAEVGKASTCYTWSRRLREREKEMTIMAIQAELGIGGESNSNDDKKRRLRAYSFVPWVYCRYCTGILSLTYALCTRMYATEELIKYNVQ